MTIDEAIQYAEDLGTEEENKIDYDKDSPHMIICRKNTVKDYRQLAEWLRELKDLREENKVLMQECDRLIKEKGELLKQHEQIGEYKRLLKSVIDEWHIVCEWGNCGEYCGWYKNGKCTQEWSGKAEALKLIGGSENG